MASRGRDVVLSRLAVPAVPAIMAAECQTRFGTTTVVLRRLKKLNYKFDLESCDSRSGLPELHLLDSLNSLCVHATRMPS